MNRRKKAKPARWQSTQIVLCYEQEPYIAFDVTPEMLEYARATEHQPTDDAARNWLIASLNQLREDVALIRDHSDEVFELERRDLMVRKAIMVTQCLLASKQQRLSTVRAVLFNLLARQSSAEPNSTGFQLAVLPKPLSIEEIRAMSTATHIYDIEGDHIVKKVLKPSVLSKPSKDRSTSRACIAIAAYWHNDQPDGFMVGVEANVEQGQFSLDNEMEVLDQVVMILAQQRPSASDTDMYLHYMAQQPGIQRPDKNSNEDRTTALQVMAAVAYAEEAGHLQSDEYNGMVYIYRVGENGCFTERKDQPQRPPV